MRPPSRRRKRCQNGTRFNKTSKNCGPFNKKGLPCEYTGNRKRCQRSTRCNVRTGKCDTTTHALRMKRCPTGNRRNRVTKECDRHTRVQRRGDDLEETQREMYDEFQGQAYSPTAASKISSDTDSFTRLLYENPIPDSFSPTRKSPTRKSLSQKSPSHKSPSHKSPSHKSPIQ
jgi:hypothetical protein